MYLTQMEKTMEKEVKVQEAVEVSSALDQVSDKGADQASDQAAVPPQLNIADLQMVAKIVDLASQRGAFRAPELSQVGETYNRLVAFLEHVQATQAKNETQPESKEESV
jgi:predicted methyltransferase